MVGDDQELCCRWKIVQDKDFFSFKDRLFMVFLFFFSLLWFS